MGKKFSFMCWFLLILILSGCSNEEDMSGTEMRLERYAGDVLLKNNTEIKEIVEGARLISEDNLETFLESSAFVSLDSTKVLKVDESSQIEVVKDEGHLDVHVEKGAVYFSVSQPLDDQETLEFHSNNVVTGVRGTSGVISYSQETRQTEVVILSGFVELYTIEEEEEQLTVSAGEVAIASTKEDGTVEISVIAQENKAVYLHSGGFFDDLEEEPDDYQEPEWIGEYTTQLNNFMELYSGRDGFGTVFEGFSSFMNPPDLADTQYVLHDLDLDGVPELLFKLNYPTLGVSQVNGVDLSYDYYQLIHCYGQFGENYELHYLGGENQHVMGGSFGDSVSEYYFVIPGDGFGFYFQHTSVDSPETNYTSTLLSKTATGIEEVEVGTYSSNSGLLPGVRSNTLPWRVVSDLSGLEW